MNIFEKALVTQLTEETGKLLDYQKKFETSLGLSEGSKCEAMLMEIKALKEFETQCRSIFGGDVTRDAALQLIKGAFSGEFTGGVNDPD